MKHTNQERQKLETSSVQVFLKSSIFLLTCITSSNFKSILTSISVHTSCTKLPLFCVVAAGFHQTHTEVKPYKSPLESHILYNLNINEGSTKISTCSTIDKKRVFTLMFHWAGPFTYVLWRWLCDTVRWTFLIRLKQNIVMPIAHMVWPGMNGCTWICGGYSKENLL